MDIYEIISKGNAPGFTTGLDNSGVNFLDPADAFEVLKNGYIHRQELKSRMGFMQFGDRLTSKLHPDNTRVMGIFENVDPAGVGTRELLVITTKYLYSYDSGTQLFNQIPMNSADPIGDFNITSRDEYVSGTTYLTKLGAKRFVFTGKGMSDIYFYDGTDVKRFTNDGAGGGDNPDYRAPSQGPLTKATKVHWFNGKLNLFVPVINGVPYHQSLLHSGIRSNTGNGDKFNVVGSGIKTASTYELMKGTILLGDMIIMKFQNSDFILEKIEDAFNPYFIRKIPSVIGTDATFSPVSWAYEAKSLSENGLITTDGRKTVRFDNKIPYFTRDQFDPKKMELVYGGFARGTSQFMWSYREKGSPLPDETQDKVLIYNYEESTWSVYDQRFSVFGETNAGSDDVWNQIDETIKASWKRWDTTDEIWNRIGLGEETQKTLAGDDEGYVYQINVDFDDYAASITAINHAATAVIATEAAFKAGDRILVSNVEGMTEINGLDDPYLTVIASTGAAITVNFDSTDTPDATINTGLVSKIIDFEAKLTPFNPYRDQGRKCYVSHIEFLLNTDAGSVYIDLYEDEEESPFKENIKLAPDSTLSKKREWISAIVDQESNFLNIKIKKQAAFEPIIISSIRIHCSPGSLTSN